MKIRILICTLFILSSFQLVNNDNTVTASYEIDVFLSDGGTFVFRDKIIKGDGFCIDSMDYINKEDYESLSQSAIIRSFNTNIFEISDIFDAINHCEPYMSTHLVSYFSDFEYAKWFGCWLSKSSSGGDTFYNYYHSLFQNKTSRKLLFEVALNILENRCLSLPKDYLDRVLIEVQHLIRLTNNEENYNYKLARYAKDCKDMACKGSPCSYINCSLKNWGESFEQSHRVPVCSGCASYYAHRTHGNYLEGFIHRRVEIDKIPLSEIHSYLLQTEERLLQLNKNNLNDEMYKFNIDKDVCITVSNGVIKIHNKNKDVQLPWNSRQVTLHKDNSGTYYLIWDRDLNKGGSIRELYNQDLELID